MIATIIKEYRKSINISLEEMAYILEISANHLSRIECKKVHPSGDLTNRVLVIISEDRRLLNLKPTIPSYLLLYYLTYKKRYECDRQNIFEKVTQLLSDYI